MSSHVVERAQVRPLIFAEVADLRRQIQQEATTGRIAGEIAPPEVLAARAEAEQILADARKTSAAICAAAEEEGYSAGFKRGHREGAEKAEHELARVVEECREELRRLTETIIEERNAFLRELEPQAVEFAWEMARRVVKEEVFANPRVVVATIEGAFRRLNEGRVKRIAIHPIDMDEVHEARPYLQKLLEGIETLEIREDRRVEQGGCLVHTESGTLDAQIETQFEQIRISLENVGEAA